MDRHIVLHIMKLAVATVTTHMTMYLPDNSTETQLVLQSPCDIFTFILTQPQAPSSQFRHRANPQARCQTYEPKYDI